ncbi:MAG: CoA transferase, partial [Sphingopyxis sp.]
GIGQRLDVAMLDAAIKLMGSAASVRDYTGQSPQGTGNRGFRLVATAEYYATQDGWIALGANHQHQIDALFRAIGHAHMLADPRFADHGARVANYDALRAWLADYMAGQCAADVELLLCAHGVPAAMLRDIGAVMDHPHMAQRGLMHAARLPGHARPLAILGPGFIASGTQEDGQADDAPSLPIVPRLGADNAAILAQLGFDDAAVADLAVRGVIG